MAAPILPQSLIRVLPLGDKLTFETDIADVYGFVYTRSPNVPPEYFQCSQRSKGCGRIIYHGKCGLYYMGTPSHIKGCLRATSSQFENMWVTVPESKITSMFKISWNIGQAQAGESSGAIIRDYLGQEFHRDSKTKNSESTFQCSYPKCPVQLRILEDVSTCTVTLMQAKVKRDPTNLKIESQDHVHDSRTISIWIGSGGKSGPSRPLALYTAPRKIDFSTTTSSDVNLSQRLTLIKLDSGGFSTTSFYNANYPDQVISTSQFYGPLRNVRHVDYGKPGIRPSLGDFKSIRVHMAERSRELTVEELWARENVRIEDFYDDDDAADVQNDNKEEVNVDLKRRKESQGSNPDAPLSKVPRVDENLVDDIQDDNDWRESQSTNASDNEDQLDSLTYEWSKCKKTILGALWSEHESELKENIPGFLDSIIGLRKEEQMKEELGLPTKWSLIKGYEFRVGWDDKKGCVKFQHQGTTYRLCSWRGTNGCGDLTTEALGFCSKHMHDLSEVVLLVQDNSSVKLPREALNGPKTTILQRIVNISNPSSSQLSQNDINYILGTSLKWRIYLDEQMDTDDYCPEPRICVRGVFPLSTYSIRAGEGSNEARNLVKILKGGLLGMGYMRPSLCSFMDSKMFRLQRTRVLPQYLDALGCQIRFVTKEKFHPVNYEANSPDALRIWSEIKADYKIDIHSVSFVPRHNVQRVCKKLLCPKSRNYDNVFILKKINRGLTHLFVGRVHGTRANGEVEYQNSGSKMQDPKGYASFMEIEGSYQTLVLGALKSDTEVIELEQLSIFLLLLYSCHDPNTILHNERTTCLKISDRIWRRAKLLFLDALDVLVEWGTKNEGPGIDTDWNLEFVQDAFGGEYIGGNGPI